MTLQGKKAVVTGGGRGIGAAVARALAAEGAAVMVAARSAGEVEKLAAELSAGGAQAEAQVCDVTDPASVAALAAAAAERLGPVDLLVNNAGVAPSAPLRSITLEEWNAHLRGQRDRHLPVHAGLRARHGRARLGAGRQHRLDRRPHGRRLHRLLRRLEARRRRLHPLGRGASSPRPG